MDNATKAIMIGVGLFITVIIISAVLVVVNLGTGAMNSASNSMGEILDNMASLHDFRGDVLTAAQVNDLLERVNNGGFNYAVTVVDNAGNVQARLAANGTTYLPVGTRVGSTAALGRNPVFARISTITPAQFQGFETNNTPAAGTADAANGYDCYVIESASNSQIGLFLVGRP